MRIGNSVLLAVTAYTAQVSVTESYLVSPLRSSTPACSSSTSFKELAVSRGIRVQHLPEQTAQRLQLYGSKRDDDINSSESWTRQLVQKIKGPMVGLVTAVFFFVMGLQGAAARPKKSSSVNSAAQKSSVKQNSNVRGTTRSKQVTKKVAVEIVVEPKKDMNSQFTKIGYGLFGVSLVATLLSGDDAKKPKKINTTKAPMMAPIKLKAVTKREVVEEDEEEDDEESAPIIPQSALFKSSKGMMSMSGRKVPGAKGKNPLEDLVNSEEMDDFFQEKEKAAPAPVPMSKATPVPVIKPAPVPLPVVKKINKFSLPPKQNAVEKVVAREYSAPTPAPVVEDDDFEFEAPPVKSVAKPPTPPPAPAKKSMFDKIFKRGSTSRPTDLGELIRVADTASDFRAATATVLTMNLPPNLGLFSDSRLGGVLSYSAVDDSIYENEESRVSMLSSLIEELEPKEASDAFADVTNAMLVSLTDRCVDMLEKRGKTPEEIEESTNISLGILSEFALSAGILFGQVLPGVILEDGGIKYNGKAQRGKLETLFSSYMKTSMDMGSMQKMMGGKTEEDTAETTDVELEAVKRQGRLQCLQHIFSISEGKKSSLEQKAMKDMIMGMMGGDGAGLGDLAGMLGNMGGGTSVYLIYALS